MLTKSSKIAAIAYVLWGLIHVLGGIAMILAGGGASGIAEMISGSVTSAEVPGIIDGIVRYYAFNICLLGIGAVGIGSVIFRKQRPANHVAAIALTGFVDAGLVFFLILPGYMTFADGAPGIVLFALGATFSILSFLHPNQ